MGFVGLILFFALFLMLIMIVMAIFAILCMIFSALSASKSKRFLISNQYSDYKSARGNFIASLVFFILTCLTSAGALMSLLITVADIVDGLSGNGDLSDPSTLFFLASPALLAAALTLGIRCFVWYGRASKLNKQLVYNSGRITVTAQVYNVCPACGSSNEPKNRFCVKCGKQIVDSW